MKFINLKKSRNSKINIGNPNGYKSLSPIQDADKDSHYCNALHWAIENRSEEYIRNIALTGPYGSGKSSVLRTFQKKYANNDLRFLNISLATFNDDKSKPTEENKNETIKLLEFSILQQIFYHEYDKNIPDSRLKKIKSHSKATLHITTICVSVLVLAIANYTNPNAIKSIFGDNPYVKSWIEYLTYGVLVIGVYTLIFKSIRIFNTLRVNKLIFEKVEIEIGNVDGKSILNHHLDEILYFFEATKYNIVILEDLDRFDRPEIFTRLRELNLALSRSKKTAALEIVFIYAVRDDMFKNQDRIKFFDFIIPVIPVINSSNSSEIFFANQRDKYEFTESLIESISLFVDDMRLLYNITNEFHLYKAMLDSSLDHNKLLAILVYKNLFPEDFVALGSDKGILFECLNSKDKILEEEIEIISGEIQTLKQKIKDLESLHITSINDLRRLYILESIPGLTAFVSFVVNGNLVSFNELASDENFPYLIRNELSYMQKIYENRILPSTNNFRTIESRVGGKSYEERKKEIEELHNVENLKGRIVILEDEISVLKNSKLKDLLIRNEVELPNVTQANLELVNVLLRNGFIEEDYLSYISIFYEGQISRADNQFLNKIRSGKKLPFEYKLEKIDKLLSKISPADFRSECILNYSLLFHVLSDAKYNKYSQIIVKQLSNESKKTVDFIDGYIKVGLGLEKFIFILCKAWPNIWNFIENEPAYSNEKREEYLKLILEHGDISDIVIISDSSNLKATILRKRNFLNIIRDHSKAIEVIKSLKLLFVDVDFINSHKQLLRFVYENNFYELNSFMVMKMIETFGVFNQVKFDNANFEMVQTSECTFLIDYVTSNLERYVMKTYLEIESNCNEPEKYLLMLINSSDLTDDVAWMIIQNVDTKISNLNLVTSPNVQEILLKEGKASSTWHNLGTRFISAEFFVSPGIIAFVNDPKNIESLSMTHVPNDSPNVLYDALFRALLLADEINDSSYELIAKAKFGTYRDLPLKEISISKLKCLIRNKKLFFDLGIFKSLKEIGSGVHIFFLEIYNSDFLENLPEMIVDNLDIEKILQSEAFSIEQKNYIIEKTPNNFIVTNSNTLQKMGEMILSDATFSASDEGVKGMLFNSNISAEDRIKIFNIKYPQVLDVTIVTEFLIALGHPYDSIILGANPLLPNTEFNIRLLEILKGRQIISSFTEGKERVKVTTMMSELE